MEREYLSIDRYLEESTNKDNKENVLATFFQKETTSQRLNKKKQCLIIFHLLPLQCLY